MGAFDVKDDDIITIRNPKWEPHESCEARTTVFVGDEEWVMGQLIKIKNEVQNQSNRAFRRQKNNGMSFDAQIGATNRLWVFRMLKSWTFTKDGMPMPLTLEAVRRLRQDYLDYIYDAITKAQHEEENEAEQGDGEEDTDPTLSSVSISTDGEIEPEEMEVPSNNHLHQPAKSLNANSGSRW